MRQIVDSASMRFRKDARLDPSQVDDLRGQGGPRLPGSPMAIGGGGIVTIIIVVALVLLGGNPLGDGTTGGLGGLAGQTVGPGSGSTQIQADCRTGADANAREDCRVVAVVNSIQSYWSKALRNYEPARTRFFDGSIDTGCGVASPAVGPFYCPRDRYVYIDLGFFDQLQTELGARGGPLAEAYVLAHEYGHHVQNLTGALQSANRDPGPQGGQVRIELQADCFAGLWVGNALGTGSSRTSRARTWRMHSTPPRRSATIASRSALRAGSRPSRGHTAPRRSGRAGSRAASARRARRVATPSTGASSAERATAREAP